MIRNGELKHVSRNVVEIGYYNPKSGDEDEITVVNFFLKEFETIRSVVSFIDYIPLSTLVNVSSSNFIDDNGYFLIFVELEKTKKTFDDIMTLIRNFNNLTDYEEWVVRIYGGKEKTISMDKLRKA